MLPCPNAGGFCAVLLGSVWQPPSSSVLDGSTQCFADFKVLCEDAGSDPADLGQG